MGEVSVYETLETWWDPPLVRQWAITALAPDLRRAGFRLAGQAENQVDLVRTYRSALAWILTVLFFPVGILFFFALKQTQSLSVFITPTESGASVLLSGELPWGIARRIREMARSPEAFGAPETEAGT